MKAAESKPVQTQTYLQRSRPLLIVGIVALITIIASEAYMSWFDPPKSRQCATNNTHQCFLYIPSGTFWFGAQSSDPSQPGYDPAALPNEGPPQKVVVNGFWIQKQEQEWPKLIEECIAAGACPNAQEASLKLISWHDAQQACSWLGGRLPTEREWEYAGRGTESFRYPWGNEDTCGIPAKPENYRLDPAGWQRLPECQKNTYRFSPTVKGLFGLEHQAWNSAEWVADRDPEYPERRMQKGGTVEAVSPDELRLAARWSAPATSRLQRVAFRCAW